MNSSSFDFNIDNYTIPDLEKFLNLTTNYTNADINENVSKFSNKISKITDIQFQNKLSDFINKVKDILTEHESKNSLTTSGSKYIIDRQKEPVTNYIQQVYPTDIAKGSITTIKKKSTFTSLCIDTLFCDNTSNTFTDCSFELPYTINNVLSMEVTSMEVPQGIFLFSENANTNSIYFIEYCDTGAIEGLVIFPSGNYPTYSTSNLPDVSTMMTEEINAQLNSVNRFAVTTNLATNQTIISNTTFIFDMYIVGPGTSKYIFKSMGWILGFRQPSYLDELLYISESIYNVTPTEYLYLEINDYNGSQIATKIIGIFPDSYLDKNIIAKLDYTYSTNFTSFNTISYDKSHLLGGIREYFGPVHLQKLYIRLLDKYGNVVDLNGLTFSFTIELKILYEL